MSLDAMKQALTALERGETKLRYDAITTLRAAIEQAEKQGSACDKDPHDCWSVRCQLGKVCVNTPPRQWVGLTLEELPEHAFGDREFVFGARWAEAKLKEKNT